MRVLALETSGMSGGVAALEGAETVAVQTLPEGARTAQSLAPAMRDVLRRAGWKPPDVRLVAVAQGPGSFTGLRLGVTTAKTFAYAVGAELLGIDTLAVIAAKTPHQAGRVWSVLGAERRQLFASLFDRDDHGRLAATRKTQIIAVDAWLGQLKPGVAVTGPPLGELAERIPPGVEIVPKEFWNPTAEWVGRVAIADYAAGRRDDVWALAPLYLRASAAEEQRRQRAASAGKTREPG